MPRLNRGAVGAVADYVQSQRQGLEEAHKRDEDFQRRLFEAGIQGEIKAGRVGLNLHTGQLEQRTPAPFDPKTLGPGERASVPIEGGGTRTYAGPNAIRPADPYVSASHEASLMRTIGQIEQDNALAPLLSEAARNKASSPRGPWGIFGRKMPPESSVPLTDVTPLRSRLEALRRGNASATTSQSTIDEQDVGGLPDGSIVEDTNTGEQFEVIGGRLVPR